MIGYLAYLASIDPGGESFAWPSCLDIRSHATNYADDPDGSLTYRESQVRRTLRLLESLRIIIPQDRRRGGKLRHGWVVKTHATPPEQEICTVSNPSSLTYRSPIAYLSRLNFPRRAKPKAKRKRIVRMDASGNVTGQKGFVTANVTGFKGFVTGQNADCDRQCDRFDEQQTPQTQAVSLDAEHKPFPVLQPLTLLNPVEPPVLSGSDGQNRKEPAQSAKDALSAAGDLPSPVPEAEKARSKNPSKDDWRPNPTWPPAASFPMDCLEDSLTGHTLAIRRQGKWTKP